MILFLLWVTSFCCTSVVQHCHIYLYSCHFGWVQQMPNACQVHLSWCMTHIWCCDGKLCQDLKLMLWRQALSPWMCSHFPTTRCGSRLTEPGRTHGGCSGSTKPLNTSPSSPLIAEKPLKDLTWILQVRDKRSFPRWKGEPHTLPST